MANNIVTSVLRIPKNRENVNKFNFPMLERGALFVQKYLNY